MKRTIQCYVISFCPLHDLFSFFFSFFHFRFWISSSKGPEFINNGLYFIQLYVLPFSTFHTWLKNCFGPKKKETEKKNSLPSSESVNQSKVYFCFRICVRIFFSQFSSIDGFDGKFDTRNMETYKLVNDVKFDGKWLKSLSVFRKVLEEYQ